MSYKQTYFGGASQDVVTFDNVERQIEQHFFGGQVQTVSVWDQPRVPPSAILTAVGDLQISVNSGTSYVKTIPAASLKVAKDVDWLVRVEPSSINPADDGTYEYDFLLVGEADGDGGNTAGIGGLSIQNTGPNEANITGQVPADQAGKKVTIQCVVKDKHGNSESAKPIVGTWTA